MIDTLRNLYGSVFGAIERLTAGWFLGLSARVMFSSVVMLYFLNSAFTKVGSGFPGVLIPTSGAYAQMLPPIAEQYGYNADKIPFFPYSIIVYAGTYAEFILPFLILLGLFTRLASVAFIGFIVVMSYVDVYYHDIDAKAIGGIFDRFQDAAIWDQRLLWCFPLIYLMIKGPGLFSLDTVIGGLVQKDEI